MTKPTPTATTSMREADRLKAVQDVVDGMMRVGQAAKRLAMKSRLPFTARKKRQ